MVSQSSARGAGYDVPAILAALRAVATKLAQLHAAGVVHGDLKQRNIIRRDGAGRLLTGCHAKCCSLCRLGSG